MKFSKGLFKHNEHYKVKLYNYIIMLISFGREWDDERAFGVAENFIGDCGTTISRKSNFIQRLKFELKWWIYYWNSPFLFEVKLKWWVLLFLIHVCLISIFLIRII
jgi:hypothetical protein